MAQQNLDFLAHFFFVSERNFSLLEEMYFSFVGEFVGLGWVGGRWWFMGVGDQLSWRWVSPRECVEGFCFLGWSGDLVFGKFLERG